MSDLKELPANQLAKWGKGDDIWAIALILPVFEKPKPVEETVPQTTPAEVNEVLHQFADIFSEPKILPLARAFDHAILLLPGVVPVNNRPYRYTPLQKDEIER